MENAIKRIRMERGISQQKCAEDVGMSLRTLQRYEKGEPIGVENYRKLAAYFEVTMDELGNNDTNRYDSGK